VHTFSYSLNVVSDCDINSTNPECAIKEVYFSSFIPEFLTIGVDTHDALNVEAMVHNKNYATYLEIDYTYEHLNNIQDHEYIYDRNYFFRIIFK